MTKELLTAVGLAVFLSACSGTDSLPTSPTRTTAAVTSEGGRFSTFSEELRSPLGVPNDCPGDLPVISRISTDASGFKADYTFHLPNNTTKAELAVFLVHNDGHVSREYFAEIVNNDGSVIKGVWDNTLTEAGRYYAQVRRIKCGKATAVSAWSAPYSFSVGSSATVSGSCEDGWREVEGADPVARCKALLG